MDGKLGDNIQAYILHMYTVKHFMLRAETIKAKNSTTKN